MGCQVCYRKKDCRIGHFRAMPQPLWCFLPELTILGCSQMSGDHLGVSFVQFGGEMKH